MLGEYYFDIRQFSLAYPLLLKYISDMPSSPYSYVFSSEVAFDLGEMFLHGLEVLQDEDKAIFYYKKSAHFGNAQSAFEIGLIYSKKGVSTLNSSESNKYTTYKNCTTQAYAWFKIAQALGLRSYPLKNGQTESVASLIEIHQSELVRMSNLKEGNQLARKICSDIPQCAQ